MRRTASVWHIATSRRALILETFGFLCVLAIAVAVRVARLGTVPRIIAGDEADNLYAAYRIIEGTGPGPLGFDWKPAPIASLYPLAWTTEVFGESVADFRLFPVITSLLTIMLFYAVARRAMGAPAGLLAMLLLATNLWFLHFSRTAWENGNAAFFALGACYATTRALETTKRWWWAWWIIAGVFCAAGLYGYFTGRFIFVSVGLIAIVAMATRRTPWHEAAFGLGLAALVTVVLFAPMADNIAADWEDFNRRTRNVSVFDTIEPYEGDTDGWVIAAKNVNRNFQGLILQDGGETDRGLWYRYNPHGRAPLDLATAVIFWAGLLLAVRRWRKTYAWFAFLVPVFIAEVFSRGTPDLARAILYAPFYFLFIGLAFDELFKAGREPSVRIVAVGAATLVASWIAFDNVRDYFQWQDDSGTQLSRMPGVDVCEFETWQTIQRERAATGASGTDFVRFVEARAELDCSAVVRAFNKDLPPTPVVIPTLTPVPTATPVRPSR